MKLIVLALLYSTLSTAILYSEDDEGKTEVCLKYELKISIINTIKKLVFKAIIRLTET